MGQSKKNLHPSSAPAFLCITELMKRINLDRINCCIYIMVCICVCMCAGVMYINIHARFLLHNNEYQGHYNAGFITVSSHTEFLRIL